MKPLNSTTNGLVKSINLVSSSTFDTSSTIAANGHRTADLSKLYATNAATPTPNPPSSGVTKTKKYDVDGMKVVNPAPNKAPNRNAVA
jgi:hypothetical protein